MLDLREVLSDFDNAQPPEELRQRVMRDAVEVFATERRGRKSTTSAGQRRRPPCRLGSGGVRSRVGTGRVGDWGALTRRSPCATTGPASQPCSSRRPPATAAGQAGALPNTQRLHARGSPVRSGWLVWIRQRAGVQCRKGLASTFLRRWSNLRMAHRSAVRRDHQGIQETRRPYHHRQETGEPGRPHGPDLRDHRPHSPLAAFGGYIPDGNTRATLLDFDGATVMINVQPSHDQAGRAEQRRVIQSFSFPP